MIQHIRVLGRTQLLDGETVKSITGSGDITITDNATTVDVGSDLLGASLGAGSSVYVDKTTTLNFKSLVGGDAITLSSDSDSITIDSNAITTASMASTEDGDILKEITGDEIV